MNKKQFFVSVRRPVSKLASGRLALLFAFLLPNSLLAETKPETNAETRYLTFQLMTVPGVSVPMPFAENPPSAPTKAQMERFVGEIVKAIGPTGDPRPKLGFRPAPPRFDGSER